MSRPLRIEFPGALYHITSRGNRKEDIFLSDEDRLLFLNTLSHTVKRYQWICHAYCLMTNHYHLLIETPEPNLSKGMRHLNGVYTQRFNRRHGRVGHVFQGRYKAILVQKDTHLLELIRYVVLNPVRAGIAQQPEDWRFSSHQAVLGKALKPDWLTIRWILRQFGNEARIAIKGYREFVLNGINQDLDHSVKGQIYYADDEFIAKLKLDKTDKEIPKVQRQPMRPSLEELIKKGSADEMGMAYREYGYRLKEIANYLGVSYPTIHRRLREFEIRSGILID